MAARVLCAYPARMKSSSDGKPWKRSNPKKKGEHTKLTPESKTYARARAAKAGRRYPNLVDNMAAAKRQKDKAGD